MQMDLQWQKISNLGAGWEWKVQQGGITNGMRKLWGVTDMFISFIMVVISHSQNVLYCTFQVFVVYGITRILG